MPIDKFVKDVRAVLAVVNAPLHRYSETGLRQFLNAVNPRFPTDTCDVLDIATLLRRSESLPAPDEIKLLEKCWQDAWGWSGQLRWQYKHPILELRYSPKKTGGYYTVSFAPAEGRYALSFPLKITARVYTDMDEASSHCDECYMNAVPDEEEEFECNCLTEVERQVEHLFIAEDSDNFAELLTAWLGHAIYGTPE